MNYEEWLKSIQFGLRRRYKVISISCGDCGMRIRFETNFMYVCNMYELKDLYDRDAFSELCVRIEKEYVNQIMNV